MPDRPNVPPDRLPELQLQVQTPEQSQPKPAAPPQVVTPEDLAKISWQTSVWPTRPPRPEALLITIRCLSKARRYTYLDHGDERWEERFAEQGFDAFDMHYVLESGYLDGKIEAGKKEGEWKAKLVGVPDGTHRKMGVVPIVVRQERLLIKTVEWEDR